MEHNVICAGYCIRVIRAVMQEKPVPEMPEGLSLQTLFAFAREHSVEALVFHGLSQLSQDETDPVWKQWNDRAELLLMQSIVQLADRDAVIEDLTGAGMEILPVKGSWLKEAYPQIDFRQMSDLDILIHRKDRELARSRMQEMGFAEEVHEDSSPHHDCYEKKPYTAVELHLQLLPSGSGYDSYYDDIWEKAVPVEGNDRLRKLPPEDEYIFYLLHMKKHMEEFGCGIRTVLDSVVYRDIWPEMDRAYLEAEYRKLGISEYVRKVETLADCWFATGEAVPEALLAMAENVLWAGAYGNLDNGFRMRMEKLKEKYKNPVVVQIVYWTSRVCRPMDEMKFRYPILEKLPVLLPVLWITRILGKLIRKPQALLHHLRQVKEGSKSG